MRPRLVSALALALVSLGCAPGAPSERTGVARERQTVDEASGASCSTSIVQGLSEQIVAQANCNAPGAYVAVPEAPNVHFGDNVFAYLEQPATNAFTAAVTEHGDMHMTLNSMLRTVAQQYLLYRWYQDGTCGIGLAATPGNSNHESGLAMDVEETSAWQSALEAHGFVWFGESDPVHYDYKGEGSVDHRGTDVLSFQQLWNRNHPSETLTEDGEYGQMTETRLRQAPAEGFPIGPSCASQDAGAHGSLTVGSTARVQRSPPGGSFFALPDAGDPSSGAGGGTEGSTANTGCSCATIASPQGASGRLSLLLFALGALFARLRAKNEWRPSTSS